MKLYYRTTSVLRAAATLRVSDSTRIKLMTESEAQDLAAGLQKRDPFARHRRERDFYVQRAGQLAGLTVIEVRRAATTTALSMLDHATYAERTAALCATLVGDKARLIRQLGTDRPTTEYELALGPSFSSPSTRQIRPPVTTGIPVTKQLVSRFKRAGFPVLFKTCVSRSALSDRIRRATDWLFDSLREADVPAAIVKTAIALETLLIFDASEPLSRVLSERTAFLLSSDSSCRSALSQVVKRFYEARSGVVHGGKKKQRLVSDHLLAAIDCLVLLALLSASANADTWHSNEQLRTWLDGERWGSPRDLRRPFSTRYLSRALQLAEATAV